MNYIGTTYIRFEPAIEYATPMYTRWAATGERDVWYTFPTYSPAPTPMPNGTYILDDATPNQLTPPGIIRDLLEGQR